MTSFHVIHTVLNWPFNVDNGIIPTTANLAILLILLNVSVVLGGAIITDLRFRKPFPKHSPEFAAESSNIPLFGSWRFFHDRWNYFRDWSHRTATGSWSYYVGVNQMVGLSGIEGRQKIFQTRELNFEEGINLLFGFTNTKNSKGEPFNDFFIRRLKGVLQTEHLQNVLPSLIEDIQATFTAMTVSPTKNFTDPFESIYRLIFQLTMRTVGCDEAASDPMLARSIIRTLEVAESCSTPETIVFPWFPLFIPRIKRSLAFLNLYSIFCGFLKPGIIRKRIQSGEKHTDALQTYLNFGDNELDTFLLIVAALFSGQVNSGINACWTLIYLAANRDWSAKALAEVTRVANQYSPDKELPLRIKLKHIPLQAWESQFPVLDACLRETIRLQTIGVICRKNVGSAPIPLTTNDTNGEILPAGAYATYHLLDAHRDASIYSEPEVWDPSRYDASRAEDKKAPLAYLGWGAGRHMCAGMRFAKLENTILAAYWLANFNSEVVGPNGESTNTLPRMNMNASSAHKPLTPCRLKFWPRADN
jgi:cytochrome P450